MKIDNIKHVFFDLDHTLWDFEKNSALTFEKIFRIHNVLVNLETFLEIYRPINFKYWKHYREEKVTKHQLRYGRLRETFNAINYEASDTLIHQLSEDYISYLTTFNHTFHGADVILKHLRTAYDLHIITNGFEEAQKRKLQNSKLDRYFKTITNSEMVGVKKPNLRIFEFALAQARAQPHESLMIGDSLEADIEGAHKAGMKAIWFNPENEDSKNAFKTITRLEELKLYL